MFVDLHHHVVFGVDDGPREFSQTQKMIWTARDNHIEHLAATAHCMPGIVPFPEDAYRENLQIIQQWCKERELSISVYPASEIMYTEATPRFLREGKIVTLGNGRNVLVEFPPHASFDILCDAARSIHDAGYRCIFAHVERYACLRNLRNIHTLRDDFRVSMQVNAGFILEPGGFFASRWFSNMLRDQCVDIIASDAHGTRGRTCNMMDAYQRLDGTCSKACLHRMFVETPYGMLTAL